MCGNPALAINGQITQIGGKGPSFVKGCMVCEDGDKETDGAAIPRDIGILLTEIEKEPVPDRLLALARELQEALARQSAEPSGPRKRT